MSAATAVRSTMGDDSLEATRERTDPHLALVRDALAGQRGTIRLLVAAVLFGQTVTAILSGANLAAELGWIRVYSTDDRQNIDAAEEAPQPAPGGAAEPTEIDP